MILNDPYPKFQGHAILWCSGVVVDCRTRITERLRVRLTPGPLRATLSLFPTYVCSGQLSLLPSAGREMSIYSSPTVQGYGVKA